MTGNVKTVYKPNQFFRFVTTEKCEKKRNEFKLNFFLWYIPLAISILVCLMLSIISLRWSYPVSDCMQELRDEVYRLKMTMNNMRIREMPDFEETVFKDYVDTSDSNKSVKNVESERTDVETKTAAPANEINSIGVMKFKTIDGATTENPELMLAKVLKNRPNHRKMRDIQPAIEMDQTINAENEVTMKDNSSIEENEELATTAIPEVEDDKNKKHITKRSSIYNQVKIPLVSGKLHKSLHFNRDSVEEFPVGPEPITVKPDTPPKRNKNRSRHNIETIDEHGIAGKRKIIAAIHLDGDSSGYVAGKHTNYNGNGHLSHPSQIYSDWVEKEWVKSLGMDIYFHLEKGLLKIKENGLYLVYVQIYYLDDHDTNGYRVYKNEETLLQCTTMTHSTERIFKGNTCYTSRVEFLKENDVISIKDLANSRYTIFESGKSFFGLVKLK